MDPRHHEIESLEEFDSVLSWMQAHRATLEGWLVQDVDLSQRSDALAGIDPSGVVFLGCTFAAGVEQQVRARGGLVFPRLPQLPFNPYRASLYSAEELYGGQAYGDSPDAVVYAWARTHLHHSAADSLATALHDHAMSNGLDDVLPTPRELVGVMGGHAVDRGTDAYLRAALLGARLARSGRTVVTGGGPGAMEAANLGARLADHPDPAIGQACALLGATPSYRPSVDAWAGAGFEVLRRFPSTRRTVGIPTWFYGHEPPNVFATAIAKYFRNALREDILLARCRGGIVYLPGAAGTVQEIFQATTSNYYAASPTDVTPMVLVGVDYWTRTVPAWPLLRTLAGERLMAADLHLVDSVEEAAEVVSSPVRAPGSV